MIWWLAALLFSAGSINSTAQVGEPTNTVGRWELLMEYASMVSVSHMIWYSHIDLLKEILELPVQWPQLTTYHSVTRLYTGAQCSRPGPQHAKWATRARATVTIYMFMWHSPCTCGWMYQWCAMSRSKVIIYTLSNLQTMLIPWCAAMNMREENLHEQVVDCR